MTTTTKLALAAALAAPSLAFADVTSVGSGPAGREFLIPTTGATALGAFSSSVGNKGPLFVGTTAGVRVGNSQYTIPAGFSTGQVYGVYNKTNVASNEPPLTADRAVYAYHSTGSINGIRDLAAAQGLATFTRAPINASNTLFVMGESVTDYANPDLQNGYASALPSTYNPVIAYSDVRSDQAFSVAGARAYNRAPTAEGYGLGRGNVGTTNFQGLPDGGALAGGVAASTTRLRNESLAVVGFTVSANPGTGLDSVSDGDVAFLNVAGRIQNGANFNYATRDIGSGTRNQGANNVNVDPSFAAGERDRVGLAGANAGSEQDPTLNLDGTVIGGGVGLNQNESRPSALARFADKTSGSNGLRQSVYRSRMALGILSSGDVGAAGRSATSANPLRVLAVDFAEQAGEVVAGPVQPTFGNITEGQYQLWSASQAITVTPDGTTAATSPSAIKGDLDDILLAGNDANGPGIARKFLDNIRNSVASGANPTTAATPFDAVLAGSFIPPQLMGTDKAFDGAVQTTRTRTTSEQALYDQIVAANSPVVSNLNWLRAGDQNGGAAAQVYGAFDVASSQGSNSFLGDYQVRLGAGTFLAGDFDRDGVRDFRDVAQLANAYANTAGYLASVASGANPLAAAEVSNSNVLDASALSSDGLRGLFAISDIDGDGNVQVVDAAGSPVTLAADYSNAPAYLAALGQNGGTGRDRVVAIERDDVKAFLYGASVDTDPTAPTFDGTTTLATIYADPTLLRGRAAGDTAANRRELGVRYGKLRKNAAVDAFNGQLDALVTAGTITAPAADALRVDKFDVNGDEARTLADARLVNDAVGRNFTVLADVATTDTDLVAAELNDTNDIVHVGAAVSDFRLVREALGALLLDGDANFDGTVSFADLSVVALNYGSTTVDQWSDGDFANYDGVVGFADLGALAVNYGASASPLTGYTMDWATHGQFDAHWALALASVPEPTAALAAAGVGALVLRRRRA